MPALDGAGTVSGVPGLPDGFGDRFESRLVEANGVALHAVVGGDGPPLLLVGGWPQTWYAWRLVMPALARAYRVVAVDERGVGRSDKPADGYDTGTLAEDLVQLMDALGHHHYGVVGHDVGMWVAYAMASDHPAVVARLAVAEAVVPGLTPSPPLLTTAQANERLWHFAFNRLRGVNEVLVRGREEVYFGAQFALKATVPLADQAVDVYLAALRASDDALRASFEFYRCLDQTMAQNERRRAVPLGMPVLAIGGADSVGALAAETMRTVASEVQELVLAGCGHFPAEEVPGLLVEELLRFFEPYRVAEGRSSWS